MITNEERAAHKAKVDEFLEKYEKRVHSDKREFKDDYYTECALCHLLTLYKDRLPIFDGYFHKAFRQADITDSGHSDMAIWCLLQGAPIFWKLFDEYVEQEESKSV